MTIQKTEEKRGRGKPRGTRSYPELYGECLAALERNKAAGGKGMSANAVALELDRDIMTVRNYLEDMAAEKPPRVKAEKLHINLILYKLPRASKPSSEKSQ
jgi:hypothetical protein